MNLKTPERTKPAFPLRIGPREARAFTIAALSDRPDMREEISPRQDVERIRRIVRENITDRLVMKQLVVWARAKANAKVRDFSFASTCEEAGWSLRTAERNVEDALAAVLYVLNRDEDCPAAKNR